MRSMLVLAYRQFGRAKLLRFLGFHGVTALAVLSHSASPVSAVMVVMLTSISVTDLLWKRIPNDFLLGGLAWTLGLTIAGIHSLSLSDCLIGLTVGFAVKLALFVAFGGGEGDVKLFAALGAMMGWRHAIDALLIGYPIAVAFACVVILVRFVRQFDWPFRFTVPMGPWFAIAAWLVGLPTPEIDHANEVTPSLRVRGD